MAKDPMTSVRRREVVGRARAEVMGVQINMCHQDYHIRGVCSHPGSKASLKKREARRRAKNKVARVSRRNNR